MPPWQPEGTHDVFEGDRRLSVEQVALFRRWVEDGALEGDASKLPAPPVFRDEWQLGKPDMVLTMPAYTLRAGGPDMFRNFVLPVPGDRMRYVRAWEFRPGNPRAVHHATMQVDGSGTSSRYDEADSDAGYEGVIAPAAQAPDGFFLDWAPGHRPNVAVPGTAWPLPPSSDLVMMLHLRPSGKTEQVQASVALYFAEGPPARVPVMVRLTRQDLKIPAGSSSVMAADSYVLPVDLDLFTVQPHAHYLAKRFSVVATRPDGTVVPLLSIQAWDFNWQDVYHYASPPRLPAGTKLSMTIAYDNTAGNPHNPSNPPVDVGYGQQTSDEMAEVWFQAVPVRDEDRPILVAGLYRKVLPEEIKGRLSMLRREPRNVSLHDDVAIMLAEVGDLPGAEREFRASLRLRPDSASAQYNVAMALLGQGRAEEASRLFAQALLIDPNHGPTHFQLGLFAQRVGDVDGADAHFATALAARPRDAEVLLAAGVLDAMRGDETRAVGRLRSAREVRPSWSNAEAALASLLSEPHRSVTEHLEAAALARRAVERTGRRNGAFLDILAGALASTGDSSAAVLVEREAEAVANAEGNSEAAEAMRARIAQWEKAAAR